MSCKKGGLFSTRLSFFFAALLPARADLVSFCAAVDVYWHVGSGEWSGTVAIFSGVGDSRDADRRESGILDALQ
jgi:hypothetical protein